MKFVRFIAIVPLALISLLNIGAPFSTDPAPSLALTVAVLALGAAGFVAAFGLAVKARWGIPAALAVAGINVIAAIVAFASNTEGAVIGLVLSALALALAFIAGTGHGRDHVELGRAA